MTRQVPLRLALVALHRFRDRSLAYRWAYGSGAHAVASRHPAVVKLGMVFFFDEIRQVSSSIDLFYVQTSIPSRSFGR